MATVLEEITASLQEIGVLSVGETADASMSADALTTLNRMMDQWQAEGLQAFYHTRTTWTIVSNDNSYTVATGADINVARPVDINHVNFVDTSTDPDTEFPMSELTEDAYAAVILKALTSTYPSAWYYNPTFPSGTLQLFPVPTSATLTGVLYARTAVATFAALTTSVSVPPGYEEMVMTNLAVRLAAPYGRQIDPDLRRRAMDAVAIVKRANIRLKDMTFEQGALIGNRPAYSIRRG